MKFILRIIMITVGSETLKGNKMDFKQDASG